MNKNTILAVEFRRFWDAKMDQKDERYNGQRRKYLSDLSQDLTICRKSAFTGNEI